MWWCQFWNPGTLWTRISFLKSGNNNNNNKNGPHWYFGHSKVRAWFLAKMKESANHHYVSAIMAPYAAQICMEFWGCSFETSRKNEQTPPISRGNWTPKKQLNQLLVPIKKDGMSSSVQLVPWKKKDDKLHFCLHWMYIINLYISWCWLFMSDFVSSYLYQLDLSSSDRPWSQMWSGKISGSTNAADQKTAAFSWNQKAPGKILQRHIKWRELVGSSLKETTLKYMMIISNSYNKQKNI